MVLGVSLEIEKRKCTDRVLMKTLVAPADSVPWVEDCSAAMSQRPLRAAAE